MSKVNCCPLKQGWKKLNARLDNVRNIFLIIFLWQILANLFFHIRIFTVFRKKNLKDKNPLIPTSVLTSDSENINRFNLESMLFTLELEIVFA